MRLIAVLFCWLVLSAAYGLGRLWLLGRVWRQVAQRWPEGLRYGGFCKFPPVQVGPLFLHTAAVGIESTGIHLAGWPFVRLLLPPIYLPWSAVRGTSEISWRGRRALEVYCSEPEVTIRIGISRADLRFGPSNCGN